MDLARLILVHHGVLHYLPFGALQNKEGQYLLEQYSLSLVPSATVWGYCMDKGSQTNDVPT